MDNKKISTRIGTIIILIIAITVGAFLYVYEKDKMRELDWKALSVARQKANDSSGDKMTKEKCESQKGEWMMISYNSLGTSYFCKCPKKEEIYGGEKKNCNIINIVGGDRDEHGCIGSAGYQWCEEKQECLRIWEEGCASSKEMTREKCEEEGGKWGRIWGNFSDGTEGEFNVCTCPKDDKNNKQIFEGDKKSCGSLEKQATADWKTYKNEKYGFEINYPTNWYYYVEDPEDVFFQDNKEAAGSIPGPHAGSFEVKVKSVAKSFTLDNAIADLINNAKKSGIDYKKENVIIDGMPGIKFITVCRGVGCGNPEWFAIKNNLLYHFISNLADTKICENILSTFKFTN